MTKNKMADQFQLILQKYWGYPDFRGIQRNIIESIACGRDTLGLMPTGGGKSITFQVPALVKDGVCIVITPLIALMKDQVQHLRERGILADAIYADKSRSEILQTLDNCIFGGVKILYVSPERLASELFQTKLKHIHVSFITVDEAHCISQWGYDFRPSYLQIAKIREMIPQVPILALTATATPEVVDDIQERLHFAEKNVFKMSFERKNLAYVVRNTSNKQGEMMHILQSVKGSAIVYARSRKRTKEMAELLSKKGISATFYHAGLAPDEKDVRQKAWQADEVRVMCATNAFGMGIDKPDVRMVIHIDCPDSLEAYFQEAGRAGRDGEDSECVLLYSPQDIMINKFFIEHREPNPDIDAEEQARLMILDKRRLNAMVDYCKTTGCLREYILKYFGERPDNPEGGRYNCHNCSNCVIDEAEREADEAYMYPGNRFSAPVSRNAAMVADRMKRSAAAAKSAYATPKSKKPEDALNDRGVMLFNRLRELRKQIAVSVGVPPYVIFSDRTLIDMCLKVPFNEEEMLSVSGVGENKYERYGKVFMDEIYDFLDGMKQNLAR